MSLAKRNQAINTVKGFRSRERKRLGYEFAMLGNNSGVVETGESGIIYIRLHGDTNQVIRALSTTSTPCGDDDWGVTVKVERIKSYAGAMYKVTGFADDLNPGDPRSVLIGRHADQHARKDYDAGGCDPVDIHPDAFLPLRAQPTSPASWTVNVLWGDYQKPDGTKGTYSGGTSPSFVPVPGTTRRCDLLYLASDGTTLTVLQGTPTVDGSTPTRPTDPGNCTPIGYVYLDSTMTAITSFATMASARMLVSSSLSGVAAAAHNIASATHSDTLPAAVTRGALFYGNATPKGTWLPIGGVAGSIVTRDATDVAWSAGKITLPSGADLVMPAAKIELLGGGASCQITLPDAATRLPMRWRIWAGV